MNFFAEIIKRLTLPTPSFFNKLAWFGGILAFLALGLGQLAVEFPDVNWLVWIAGFQKDIAAAGGIILLISKLPVKPEVPNQKL